MIESVNHIQSITTSMVCIGQCKKTFGIVSVLSVCAFVVSDFHNASVLVTLGTEQLVRYCLIFINALLNI